MVKDIKKIIKNIIETTTKEERKDFDLFDIEDSYDVTKEEAKIILNEIKK